MLKESVVLVYNYRSKFIEIDSVILNERFDVIEVDLNSNYLKKLLKFFHYDGVHVYWFVSFKTLPFVILSYLLRRRIKIISGGFDISDIKGYGMFSTWLGSLLQNLQFGLAETILVNSRSSYDELINRLPRVSNKLCFLYHVLDYSPLDVDWTLRDIDFVTVGSVKSVNMSRKGLTYFIELARSRPSCNFVLVGPVIEPNLLADIPTNIKVTGFVSEEEKLRILRRAKYYCQVSEHEGFGLSVLEAQVQGCFILHNNVGGLKESAKIGRVISTDNILQIDAEADRISFAEALRINKEFDYLYRLLGLQEFVSISNG